jgi:hypothetical protein
MQKSAYSRDACPCVHSELSHANIPLDQRPTVPFVRAQQCLPSVLNGASVPYSAALFALAQRGCAGRTALSRSTVPCVRIECRSSYARAASMRTIVLIPCAQWRRSYAPNGAALRTFCLRNSIIACLSCGSQLSLALSFLCAPQRSSTALLTLGACQAHQLDPLVRAQRATHTPKFAALLRTPALWALIIALTRRHSGRKSNACSLLAFDGISTSVTAIRAPAAL